MREFNETKKKRYKFECKIHFKFHCLWNFFRFVRLHNFTHKGRNIVWLLISQPSAFVDIFCNMLDMCVCVKEWDKGGEKREVHFMPYKPCTVSCRSVYLHFWKTQWTTYEMHIDFMLTISWTNWSRLLGWNWKQVFIWYSNVQPLAICNLTFTLSWISFGGSFTSIRHIYNNNIMFVVVLNFGRCALHINQALLCGLKTTNP